MRRTGSDEKRISGLLLLYHTAHLPVVLLITYAASSSVCMQCDQSILSSRSPRHALHGFYEEVTEAAAVAGRLTLARAHEGVEPASLHGVTVFGVGTRRGVSTTAEQVLEAAW